MGFLFEMLAPLFGGMLSQLYQEGKVSLKKLFLLSFLIFSICFSGMFYFRSTAFKFYDLILAFSGGTVAAFSCLIIIIIYKSLNK